MERIFYCRERFTNIQASLDLQKVIQGHQRSKGQICQIDTPTKLWLKSAQEAIGASGPKWGLHINVRTCMDSVGLRAGL